MEKTVMKCAKGAGTVVVAGAVGTTVGAVAGAGCSVFVGAALGFLTAGPIGIVPGAVAFAATGGFVGGGIGGGVGLGMGVVIAWKEANKDDPATYPERNVCTVCGHRPLTKACLRCDPTGATCPNHCGHNE